MSNTFDINALKEKEKELKERSGSNFFVRLDENESKDIRILEPTPSMKKLYFVEVPIWWIGGNRIVNPTLLGEEDIVQNIIDEYEVLYKKDKAEGEFNQLMKAKTAKMANMVSKTSVFWLPIVEFAWKLDSKGEEILGILDKDGNYDVDQIKNFIVDKKAKIFEAKISLVNDITKQVTTGRGGSNFFDRELGMNITVVRAGSGRDTKYSASKQESMPMPEEFYGENALDVYTIAKSSMFTNEYIGKILDNYFDGQPLPEEKEFRFKELREQLKGSSEEETISRPRRGRRGSDEGSGENEGSGEETSNSEPTVSESEPSTRSRRGKEAPAGRRSRNLADDVEKHG